MKTLRVESTNGVVSLVTGTGEVIPADMVTIKLARGQRVKIKAEVKGEKPRYASYSELYANVR